MKPWRRYADSLTLRLILAFMLAAVPSVLMASEIALSLSTRAFNRAVENWLRETSNYVIATMLEAQDDLQGVFTIMRDRFAAREISFTQEEIAAMSVLDAEAIMVRDEAGAVIFSAGPLSSIDEAPLVPEGFRLVTTPDGDRQAAFVFERTIPDQGWGVRRIFLVEFLGLDTYLEANDQGRPSLILRIFLPDQGGFNLAYSSTNDDFHLPDRVAEHFLAGGDEYFVPDKDWTDGGHSGNIFFQALRDDQGHLAALLATDATMADLDGFVAANARLFWGLLLGGTLISGAIGYVLARRIVRPIKELDRGVRHVADGRLGYEVPVAGAGEIAGLARGFNLMSRQLQVMRRDKDQSAKRERTRMLGEIALGFAHEIRNPLVVIKTSAEMVHARLQERPKDARLLGFVIEEVERINQLISEFLGFAKPGSPQMALEPLGKLVDMALTLCQAQFAERNVTCDFQIEVDDDRVPCDARQMQQVFLNLMLNAVEAMPDGGRLTLRLRAGDEGQVCLEVSDTGQGISPDLLPEIHLPFVSTKEKGLGLGLAKVYAIMEEHGGSVRCESAPGRGTTFTVCLKKTEA